MARPGPRSSTASPMTTSRRVIREDPNRKGLLFAGTEFGIYVSYNGGDQWQSIQLNLPVVPITDLAFHKRDDELVVATQGRAFWIMDDLGLLFDLKGQAPTDDARLFKPKTHFAGRRRTRSQRQPHRDRGRIKSADRSRGRILAEGWPQESGDSRIPGCVRQADQQLFEQAFRNAARRRRGWRPPRSGPTQPGMNRFVWDLHYADASTFPNMIFWAGSTRGPLVVPGSYQVRLTVDGKSQTQSFNVVKDPRLKTTRKRTTIASSPWRFRSATNFRRPIKPSSTSARRKSSSMNTRLAGRTIPRRRK